MTSKTAMVYGFCIAMLAGAWAAGRQVSRPLPVADIDLASLPKQLGPWHCEKAGYYKGYKTKEAAFYTMTFTNGNGERVNAIVSVTRSRLGALRDWSLAREGQGWVLGLESVRQISDVSGIPFAVQASVHTLSKMDLQMVAFNWYVSPTAQSPKFTTAQLLGWRDRLLGRDAPWGQLYVISSPKKQVTEEDRRCVEDLFVRLASHFYAVLTSATRG